MLQISQTQRKVRGDLLFLFSEKHLNLDLRWETPKEDNVVNFYLPIIIYAFALEMVTE